MKAAILFFECITNMHVGSGEENYNIIDNEVERDPVTGFPTINSSGVKGALREFFKSKVAPNVLTEEDINNIFGKDGKDMTQGKVKILSAELIASPARASKGNAPYYLLCPKTALEELENKMKLFCSFNKGVETIPGELQEERAEAEGIPLKEVLTLKISPEGKKVCLVKDKDYLDVDLPVMARNALKDGKSDNLWHEEVVPHKSLFYFPVLVSNDGDEIHLKKFLEILNGQIVQFGGNASIGYGLCKIFSIVTDFGIFEAARTGSNNEMEEGSHE